MTWLIVIVAIAAVIAIVLFLVERRYEHRSVDDAQRELDRIQHSIDTMTVKLERPDDTSPEDRYLDEEGRAPREADSNKIASRSPRN